MSPVTAARGKESDQLRSESPASPRALTGSGSGAPAAPCFEGWVFLPLLSGRGGSITFNKRKATQQVTNGVLHIYQESTAKGAFCKV